MLAKERNTPGTGGGPGGCDRTLAVKSRKTAKNQLVLIVLLVMANYEGSYKNQLPDYP